MLVYNTAIKKALNCKMHACYLGPLVVLACNLGGAYILAKLDGLVLDQPTVAFHVVPYLTRRYIPLPSLTNFLDISLAWLEALKNSHIVDPEEDNEKDFVQSEDEDQWAEVLHLMSPSAICAVAPCSKSL